MHTLTHRLIIGAPFGNWFRFAGTTPTLGTFTRHRRGGFLYRLWRCLRTLRYKRHLGGWVNRLGLPNPGIDSLLPRNDLSGSIVSIHGFNATDWDYLACSVEAVNVDDEPVVTHVEFNLSCPNVSHAHTISDVRRAIQFLHEKGMTVIAKLPPVRWFDLGIPLYDLGVRCFHLCNTLPVPGGGLSGKALKPYSLRAVEEFRNRWGSSVELIGGGGVTCEQDVRDYLSAGADRVAVASMLLNPLNWRCVPRLRVVLEEAFAGRECQKGLSSCS